ncbi:MAG: glycosyltransferase [Bacillota bacterium]
MSSNLALCICTYKRANSLRVLLDDVTKQTLQPEKLIIVDGDPGSNEVLQILDESKLETLCEIVYVASNHGNQTYQRYLGFRVAKSYVNLDYLLFLDDDLRIHHEDSIRNIIFPLTWEKPVVSSVTGNLIFSSSKINHDEKVTLSDLRGGLLENNIFAKLLGSKGKVIPGDVSPTGNRVLPATGQKYANIRWLSGGSIAFRLSLLDENILSDDIFAMNYLRLGLCEDLVISRRMLERGDLIFATNATFHHPSETSPTAYSSDASRFGYALAYSRRWFNDNYRGLHPPTFGDRVSLLKFFIGSLLVHWFKALVTINRSRIGFAAGFTKGVIEGLLIKPTAKNLTPNIDWWKDAEEALRNVVTIH